LVGYLTREYGLVYGLILGVFPAIFALAVFPTAFFSLSAVGGAVVLFVAYVLLSGLSGAGGQSLARWRVSIREIRRTVGAYSEYEQLGCVRDRNPNLHPLEHPIGGSSTF